MKITEARRIARAESPTDYRLPIAALTMAAVLDQIEQACTAYGDYEADGLLHDISDILDGKRT